MRETILSEKHLDLSRLIALQQKPEPFTPGVPCFWDDPHISKHMLAAHLDEDTDVASRKAATIDASVAWIVAELDLQAGQRVLDLGCGPGLYANRFAQLGLQVTGVDYSERSIKYARSAAEQLGLAIEFRYQDYLTLAEKPIFDAALLIYGEYCVFNPDQRCRLLANIMQALKPGGAFVFDVTTPDLSFHQHDHTEWQAVETGFWKEGPHLVLTQGFAYPESSIYLDQYLIIEADGSLSVYRNWFQDFGPDRLTAELEKAGFSVQGLWADLTGKPYTPGSEWIGVVAKKPA